MGPPPPVPGVRPDAVLRQQPAAAHDRPLAERRAPRDEGRLRGRRLDVVLPDNAPIREAEAGGWETYDAFAEAGVPVMAAHIAAAGACRAPTT